MGPAAMIVAGVLLDKMKEAQARKQAGASLYMQRAKDLNPNMPTYQYDAAKANAEIEAQRGQMVAKLLPFALQNAFSEKAAPGASQSKPFQLTPPPLVSGAQDRNLFGLPRLQTDIPGLALSNDPASQYAQLTQPQLLGGF